MYQWGKMRRCPSPPRELGYPLIGVRQSGFFESKSQKPQSGWLDPKELIGPCNWKAIVGSNSRTQGSNINFEIWSLSTSQCSFPLGSLFSSKLVPSGATSSPWVTPLSWLLWRNSGDWVSLDPPGPVPIPAPITGQQQADWSKSSDVLNPGVGSMSGENT